MSLYELEDMNVLDELIKAEAVITDSHFVYRSFRHGPSYVAKERILANSRLTSRLTYRMVWPFIDQGKPHFDTLFAAAVAGATLLQSAAYNSQRTWPATIFADQTPSNTLVLKRLDFADHLRGRRVLILEDVITTGGTVAELRELAYRYGAVDVMAAVMVNRGGVTAGDLGVSALHSLAGYGLLDYSPEECPLCRQKRPVVDNVGRGAKFREDNPEHPGGFTQLAA